MGKFKDLKRTGWINNRVKSPESDAEHSFSLAVLAILLAPQSLNKLRCLELALIHDLPEIYAGDITPHDGMPLWQKQLLEQNAAQKIAAELDWPNLIALFEEYNAKETQESLFVNALDKLDTVLTAAYYDNNNRSPHHLLQEFAAHAEKSLKPFDNAQTASIKDILARLSKKGNKNE